MIAQITMEDKMINLKNCCYIFVKLILFASIFNSFAYCEEITDKLQIISSRLSYDRLTKTNYIDIEAKNTSTYTFKLPLYLTITDISSADVSVSSFDGITSSGVKYIELKGIGESLGFNDITDKIRIIFENPINVRFLYKININGEYVITDNQDFTAYSSSIPDGFSISRYDTNLLQEFEQINAYELNSSSDILSPVCIKDKKINIDDNEYLEPVTFNNEEERFMSEGYIDNNGNICVPHFSIWASISRYFSDLSDSLEHKFTANTIKGAFIGLGLHQKSEFTYLLDELKDKKYNRLYVNRGGIEINPDSETSDDPKSALKIQTLDNAVDFDLIFNKGFNLELVFGMSESTFDYIKETFDTSNKQVFYEEILKEFIPLWILSNDFGIYSDNKTVHLNLESTGNDDEIATIEAVKIFKEYGWNVTVSICDNWSSVNIKNMYTSGASFFSYQLYNLGIDSLSDVLYHVNNMRKKFVDYSIPEKTIILTFPYYRYGFHHSEEENISFYADALTHYRYLENFGGAYVYDFAYFPYTSTSILKIPYGDDYYIDQFEYEDFDKIYTIRTSNSALLVPNKTNLEKVENEFLKIMQENGNIVDVIGASDLNSGIASLDGYNSISCFTYGGPTVVANIDQSVTDAVMSAVSNGATFVTNNNACGAAILSQAGYWNAAVGSGWYPALKDSFYITSDHYSDPILNGVSPETRNPYSYSVSYWDSGDLPGLVFRIDNTLSYVGRYTLTGTPLITPTRYLASGFSCGWNVNPVSDSWFPEWKLGDGRIVIATSLAWTFNQSTKYGGYIGIAGRKILQNIATLPR